jgi:hypothetical protein
LEATPSASGMREQADRMVKRLSQSRVYLPAFPRIGAPRGHQTTRSDRGIRGCVPRVRHAGLNPDQVMVLSTSGSMHAAIEGPRGFAQRIGAEDGELSNLTSSVPADRFRRTFVPTTLRPSDSPLRYHPPISDAERAKGCITPHCPPVASLKNLQVCKHLTDWNAMTSAK